MLFTCLLAIAVGSGLIAYQNLAHADGLFRFAQCNDCGQDVTQRELVLSRYNTYHSSIRLYAGRRVEFVVVSVVCACLWPVTSCLLLRHLCESSGEDEPVSVVLLWMVSHRKYIIVPFNISLASKFSKLMKDNMNYVEAEPYSYPKVTHALTPAPHLAPWGSQRSFQQLKVSTPVAWYTTVPVLPLCVFGSGVLLRVSRFLMVLACCCGFRMEMSVWCTETKRILIARLKLTQKMHQLSHTHVFSWNSQPWTNMTTGT